MLFVKSVDVSLKSNFSVELIIIIKIQMNDFFKEFLPLLTKEVLTIVLVLWFLKFNDRRRKSW